MPGPCPLTGCRNACWCRSWLVTVGGEWLWQFRDSLVMRMLAVAMRTAAWVTAPPGDQRNHRTREFSRRPPSVLADRRPRSVQVRLEEPGGHSEVRVVAARECAAASCAISITALGGAGRRCVKGRESRSCYRPQGNSARSTRGRGSQAANPRALGAGSLRVGALRREVRSKW